jgi:S1-C subfamily serine protease
MQQPASVAKTVILSSVLTTLILGVTGYTLRSPLAAYVLSTQNAPVNSPDIEIPLSVEDKVVQSVARVNPAVVSVLVTKDVPVYEQYYQSYNPFGLYGGFSVPRIRENGTQEQEVGGGSGFIVSNDGMIVTNRHVVSDLDARYSVLLNDGTAYDVTVLARDAQLDVAILQISEPLKKSLPFVSFGDSQSLRLGETVIAIGNALAEFRNSVSVGVVSGVARSIVASDGMGGSEQLNQVIQTDAAINPGNSGGPLLNVDGEVIGVNVAVSRGADNISFALPAQVVKQVVDSVREYGEIVRPYLGVRYVMLNEQIAEANSLDYAYGALVLSGDSPDEAAVILGSPADKANISENTIILSIDGEELRGDDLATVLREKNVGDEIVLVVEQDGEVQTVRVVLEKFAN